MTSTPEPALSAIEAKVQAHFGRYPLRRYPKGHILIFAEENPEAIFYLIKGRVRQYDTSYRGDEIIVNIFKPRAFFPMSLAVNHPVNKYFYKMETACEVHVVPIDDALAFITDNPDVMLDLLSRLYRGMDGILGRLVHLMSGTAKSRLMYELIVDYRRFGKESAGTPHIVTASEIDLAARAGLSRETINRELQKLKTAGLISIANRVISIPDAQALENTFGKEI